MWLAELMSYELFPKKHHRKSLFYGLHRIQGQESYIKWVSLKEFNTPNLVSHGKLCTRLECIHKLITWR